MTPAFPADAREAFAAAFPEKPLKLRHSLVDHPMLTLGALVELAARHDPKDVEYNPGNLPIGIAPEEIPSPTLSISETIRSIEENGSWMVIKFIEKDPAYKALLHETLGELRTIVEPRLGAMLTLEGFIFVSASGAVTPFHFDPEHNILLQVRGEKTFTIFPQSDEAIVPPLAHEKFHLGQQHRNLVWSEEFAPKGKAITLAPGDALHVPVKAPHWVKVTQGPSVSLSVTWRSEWSYAEADARAFNHMLRKRGLNPASPKRYPAQNRVKSLAFRTVRRLRGG
jgi:Cupin-like domain